MNTFKTGPDGRCYYFPIDCTPPSWDDIENEPECSGYALGTSPPPYCDELDEEAGGTDTLIM